MSRLIRTTVFTIIAIAVMAILPVSAQIGNQTQSPPPVPPDSAAGPPPLVAITAADVPRRAEETSAGLRDIKRGARPEQNITETAQKFPEIDSTIDERITIIDSLAITAMSSNRLSMELQWWERARSQLGDWQSTLRKRSSVLVAYQDTVRNDQAVWDLTRESTEEVEMPEAITLRVSAVLADIDTVGQAVTARLDSVLTLQNLISQRLVSIDEAIGKLQETQSHVQRLLFAADSPPIWKLVFAPPDSAQLQDSARDAVLGNRSALEEYASKFGYRFLDQLIVAILVLITMVALSVKSRSWLVEGDADLSLAVATLGRPVAVALLIALVLSGLFHPQAPASLISLARIILLAPLFRLIPVLIRPEARRPVYFVTVLFALDQTMGLVPDQTGVQRLLQILLAGLSIVGLVWLVRVSRKMAIVKGWTSPARFLIRLAILLLVISISGNVFGYSALAKFLLSATVTSGFMALLLLITYRVTRAIIAAILQTNAARRLQSIRQHTPLIKGKVYRALRVAGVSLWLVGTLVSFGIWSVCWARLSSFMGKNWDFGSMSISIGDIVVFFFAIWLSVQISKFVTFMLSEDILPHLHLSRGVPSAITRITGLAIVTFGFVLAAASAGIDLNKFTLLAGALGVGVGFGMQNVVNNFVSSLILIIERPISAGDLIQYGTLWGTVKRIGFRSSTLRTFSGADVIVPNGNLISTEVTNWSRSEQLRRVEVKVGVAYGTDPGTVMEVLEKTIEEHSEILKEPAPYAVFHGFGDSALDFEIRGWTKLDDWLRVTTETTVMVNNALKEAGIHIPFPQRDLHLRTMDPEIERTLAMRKKGPTAGHDEPPVIPPAAGQRARTHDQDMDADS